MTAKRYEIGGCSYCTSPVQIDDGEWMRAEDYDRLRAEVARLREALECMVDAADTAPPVELIAYISRAVEKARAALAPVEATK